MHNIHIWLCKVKVSEFGNKFYSFSNYTANLQQRPQISQQKSFLETTCFESYLEAINVENIVKFRVRFKLQYQKSGSKI